MKRENIFLKEKDVNILNKILAELKKFKGIIGIVQIGSSTYSKKYNDIDLMIFFNSFLVPPGLDSIRKKYSKYKFWIEGINANKYKRHGGMKVFIKFFNHLKNKKILYGRNPYKNKKISLAKSDVANYIGYYYELCELHSLLYDNLLFKSMNAMLTYKDKFPKNKYETLDVFIKTYPKLAKFLPKNAKYYLTKTNAKNFKNLYPFFEKSLKYFGE